MTPLRAVVAGIGAWSAAFGDWTSMRAAIVAPTGVVASQATGRPTPQLLPAAERRRVPDGVAVALEVARQALEPVIAAGTIASSRLASVFASAHGELAIVDYLGTTLADDPLLLSPTRFHHSVHNAAGGYWGIATGSLGPSTALAAGDDTVALGLLEAMTQVASEGRPVLFVVFDTPGTGLAARTAPNTALFGAALLLAPPGFDESAPMLSVVVDERAVGATIPRAAALRGLAASSPAARATTLLEALAHGGVATIDHPTATGTTVSVRVLPARVPAGATVTGTIE